MSVRFLLLVVVFVGCSDTSPLQSFDDVFEKVAEVPLDAQVLLGGVTAMDVDESGRIVIADMNSGSTHLFEKNGTLIRSFAATECNPGEESRPFRVRFVSRDRFVVSTLNRTTYEFSATEGCRWKVDAMTPAPRSTCRTDTDNVFGFFYERPQARVVRYNPDLSPIDTLSLAVTDFPRLNTTFNISQYLACSAGDAMYIYAESSAPRYVEQPEALAWEPPGFFRQITDEVEHSPKGVDGFQEGRRTIVCQWHLRQYGVGLRRNELCDGLLIHEHDRSRLSAFLSCRC